MAKRGNSEGSIYKRKDGRWAAALTLPDGRRRAYYGRTRQEVARRLTTAKADVQRGLPLPLEKLTVGAFLAQWLELAKPTVRATTWERYGQYIGLHATPTLGHLRLAHLEPRHLLELYANKLQEGLSPTTVAHLHAVLHRALAQGLRLGLTGRNVADSVDPPRVARQEIRSLSPEEARRFLQAAQGDRLEALYQTALTTGLRQGELLALGWQDVDLERGALQVRRTLQRTEGGVTFSEPKSARSRRQVSLSWTTVEALRHHRLRQIEERLRTGSLWEDQGLVFTNEIGRPLERGNLLKRSFRRLLQKAGLPPMRFHDLRHSAASLLLALGTHPKIVQELLGHSAIGVTLDTYSHVLPTLQQEAVDRLERLLTAVS